MTIICNQEIRIPSRDVVESALWVYPNEEFVKKTNHIVLLVSGKDNTGFGAWSWSYGAQMPHDYFIPATITLSHRNTDDACYSGKYIPMVIEILCQRYPGYRISIVAHSAGNLAVAWALHYRPAFMAKHVESYVAIGAPFQGIANPTNVLGKQPLIYQCDEKSRFIREINSSPFPKPIRYLSIISANDEISESKDQKVMASFPHGTEGEVQTPQEVFKIDRKISHVGELADNCIYEMVKAFLRNAPVIRNASELEYYPYIEKEGIELLLNHRLEDSHRGDAPDVEHEPGIYDIIM